MLLGRDLELGRLDALIDAARQGLGGALVVRGEAGIGKTALLAAARDRADGLRILSACGTETEAHLPFAALAQLVEPVLDGRDRLPRRQAAALDGALALGPPAPGDRFAVCVATLGLLEAAAADGPVLLLVDDAHWLDPASAECLGFAARRLGGTRIAMLLAVRDPERAASGIEELPTLRTTALVPADAQRVLAARAPELVAAVRDAVVSAAAGNPLALVEIASQLTPDERSGRAPLPEPLRPGGRLGAVFERRVLALPQTTRDALVVAAAAGGGDVATIWQACGALGLDGDAIEAAEADALVRIAHARLVFTHPLVRSAAYHAAPLPQRRAAHRGLAGVIEGDRRAWHLAAAAPGPDEEAARALQDAGTAAAERRGYVEAAAAYERAAELTPEPDTRARRLRRASNMRIVAGHLDRALALLDELVALGTPTGRDPRLVHTRSLLLIGTGQFAAGYMTLKALAQASVGVAEPAMTAFLHADAAMAALVAGDCRDVLALAQRAAELLGDGGDPRVRANVVSALSAGRVFGRHAPAARADLHTMCALVAHLDPLDWQIGSRIHALAIHVCNALEAYEEARALAGAALAVLDDAGAVGARANPLSHASDAAYRLGDWDVAWRETAEAIALAEETSADETLVRALVHRARLLAARGFEADAREHAERALAIAERCGIGTIPPYANAALAFIDLGHRRPEAVIARLEGLGEIIATVHGMVHPMIIPWRQDLCEAYAMAGRLDDARREAAILSDEADCVGGAAGRAVAARCAGLVADAFDEPFERALALDAERPMRFERARTLLAWGERLRRARRRAEARQRLHEAEDVFAALAAAPWCDRAAAELAASGAVRRTPTAASRHELTAQEQRVATTIARGLTIREAAAELFLSPKTVDFHLQQIYGKLAIRSRAELAVIAVERGWLA